MGTVKMAINLNHATNKLLVKLVEKAAKKALKEKGLEADVELRSFGLEVDEEETYYISIVANARVPRESIMKLI